MGCTKCGRKPLDRRESEETLSTDNKNSTSEIWPLWKKAVFWTLISLLVLVVVLVLLIWVAIPIAFWQSLSFQRFMIFMPIDSPRNPDFHNPESYGITGVRNFYISVSDYYNASTVTQIGAWLILPETDKTNPSTNITGLIQETDHDILLYFHGVLANRAQPIWQYQVFRKHFLVIAIDHRGYGDSGANVEMTEDGMVNDHVQIYDWLARLNIKKGIYYWGHSLGTALSCRTVRLLKEQRDFVPKGLILESAFTTMAEEVTNSILGKIYRWLPYFNGTILKPLDENGFRFYSTSHIRKVDCPIMFLHAQDDRVVPFFLGERLFQVAINERDLSKVGDVIFVPFDAKYGYGHNDITRDPNITQYIEDFKALCQTPK